MSLANASALTAADLSSKITRQIKYARKTFSHYFVIFNVLTNILTQLQSLH